MPALPLDWSIGMRTSFNYVTNRTIGYVVAFLLLLCPHAASAITYMSIETVPNRDVVGEDDVVTIRSIGYANLERWSQRLLDECRVVDSVIDALTANATISSVTSTNTRVVVAAGGFEGGTNPSFVFTVKDSGAGSVTEADVDVLGNALGYVLSQGSTAHFSPDNFKAYAAAASTQRAVRSSGPPAWRARRERAPPVRQPSPARTRKSSAIPSPTVPRHRSDCSCFD
jgi:hypothetical protein